MIDTVPDERARGLVVGAVVRTGEPFVVTADGVARFAAATRGATPGPTHVWVPVLRLLEQTMDEAGIPMRGIVHRDQTFSLRRAPEVGDVLMGTATVGEVRRLPGAHLVGVDVELSDQHGRHVCSARSTVVVPEPGQP